MLRLRSQTFQPSEVPRQRRRHHRDCQESPQQFLEFERQIDQLQLPLPALVLQMQLQEPLVC